MYIYCIIYIMYKCIYIIYMHYVIKVVPFNINRVLALQVVLPRFLYVGLNRAHCFPNCAALRFAGQNVGDYINLV